MKTQKGFNLIELMIVVVIAGVLAAIAIPAYQNSVIKGNRAAAQAFMMDVASREKQYLLDARSYTNSLATLYNVATPAAAVPTNVSKHYPAANIVITCNDGASAATGCTVVANSPPTFLIKATPTSSQQAADGWLSLSNDDTKNSQYSGKW